jgi:intracellular sulfur oxidation DsrE/DsrF family protein
MPRRRDFLSQLGLAAATFALDADELQAAATSQTQSTWDTTWLDRLAKARYRVVFNASAIDDGGVFSYASGFFDQYHEVHNTTDAETTPVVVFRRLGTPMVLNDHLWDRYELGKDTSTNDPDTGTAARRNVFWRAGRSGNAATKIETLHQRGMISLVCNVSLGNIGRRFAEKANGNVEEVQQEFRTNLVPGAIVVPSGVYALIRAQNAGCAYYMPGS